MLANSPQILDSMCWINSWTRTVWGLMTSLSWEKPFGRNINNLKYAGDTTLMEERGTKESLDEGERGEWKSWLKLNIQKTKIMASGPITSWQIDGEQWKKWQTLFSWAPKSLQMVGAAMKLKNTCFMEE